MWRSTKEEWERTKTYLIRSLFEDLPALSPIYESQESASPSPHDYRYEINLPDLIIEKEPRKLHFHDEPEEFYEKLEKEMRQLYKRDFLDIVEQCSTPCSDIRSELESVEETSSSDKSDCVEQEYRECEIPKNMDLNIRDSIDTFGSTESENCYEQIVTQVEVHMDKSKKVIQERLQNVLDSPLEGKMSGSSKSKDSTSRESYQLSDHGLSATVEREVTADINQNKGLSVQTSTSKSLSDHSQRSPETMRRMQSIFHRDSLPYQEELTSNESADKTTELGEIGVDTTLAEGLISAGIEMEIAESSPTTSLQQRTVRTSTPKSTPLLKSNSKVTKRCRKRLVSFSTSSEILSAKCNIALQTSFSDDEPDLSSFWNNFFIGTPTVYKICTCSNHLCS